MFENKKKEFILSLQCLKQEINKKCTKPLGKDYN